MLCIERDYLGILSNLVERAQTAAAGGDAAHRLIRRGRTSTPWVSFPAPFIIDFRVGGRCRLPLLTTKKMHAKSILAELVWFLRGDTNVRWLQERGVTIWNEWADPAGNLGPVYGHQWRRWRDERSGTSIDQVQRVLDGWRRDPYDRGLVVSAWNVADLGAMALRPCHYSWQITCPEPGVMDIHVTQRSADWFLGVPYNLVSYSALLILLAKAVGATPGTVWWSGADCHLYLDHIEAAQKQLAVRSQVLARLRDGGDEGIDANTPTLRVADAADIYNAVNDDGALTLDMFEVVGYNPVGPVIRAPVAV